MIAISSVNSQENNDSEKEYQDEKTEDDNKQDHVNQHNTSPAKVPTLTASFIFMDKFKCRNNVYGMRILLE